MDLKELAKKIEAFSGSLASQDKKLLKARLSGLISAFPFNEYEYTLMFLTNKGVLSFEDYEKLRSAYVAGNIYLELFELAPRIFGEIWGQEHLLALDARFKKPTKKLEAGYVGQYDLLIENARVEVKAARAIQTKVRGSLVSKAMHIKSDASFWMNFQQIKLDVCDVFVFIGVWIDQIVYWILSNEEIKNHPCLSHQHRGGIEYQIGITDKNLSQFDKYKVASSLVGNTVLLKGARRAGGGSASNRITCSMSAVGSCANNAAAESFFGVLKRERVNRRQYRTRAEARADIFDDIER